MYAEISPETMPEEEEEEEEESFRDETRAFMMPTATLKEIVDDLEWPCGNVRVEMIARSCDLSRVERGWDAYGGRGRDGGTIDGVYVSRTTDVDVQVSIFKGGDGGGGELFRRWRGERWGRRERRGQWSDDDARVHLRAGS